MDIDTPIKNFTALDGTEFIVTKDESDLYHVYTKFTYISGGEKYKNNFIKYASSDIKDKDTAIGIALFSYNCYERGITQAISLKNVKR
ncbi:hypothetical protein QTG56_25170 (plasmid) [Rossellomorea sp. AcN35-11]|nr:hypothetical protein [Rossellomorea aquimaris]WJV31926.1 hypothetical protein QTG56_25170 [Rossellomorea sp. AcN35-11]